MGEDTKKLRAIAPAAAEWPSWWRRNLTPGALYTIGAVVFIATVTVTTFIVLHHSESTDLAAVKVLAESMSGDLKHIKESVADLKKWKDDQDTENRRIAEEARKRNPYIKQRKPQ